MIDFSDDQLLMLLAVALLGVVGFAFLSMGGAAEKRLRERTLAIKQAYAKRDSAEDTFLLQARDRKKLFSRVADALGYRPDLPPAYRPSVKLVCVIAGALGFLALHLLGPVIGFLPALLVAAGVFAAVATFQFRRKNAAYRTILFKQIPDTMSLMLRAVRAGLPVAEAIRSVSRESLSPTREEFGRVSGEVALGAPVELTLRRLFDRTGVQEFAFFAVVIGLHGQTGGNLAETLENLADTVRRRVAMAAKARALAAEGRLSAMVIGGLPFVVAAMVSVMNPDYLAEFWTTSGGQILVAAFAALMTLGMGVTHLLVQRSTQD